LRNHGFLRTNTAGWSLAPAFDLNPNPRPGAAYLSTRIDYDTTEASVDVLMGVAEFFRLTDDDARSILRDVTHATSRWRHAAKQAGLDRDAVDNMAAAFEHDQTATARQLTGAPV
jgi:serine/threonine-protein kinase HipA